MTPDEIKQARQALGLNIQEMAGHLGVNRDTYSQWEKGRRKLPAIGGTAIRWLVAGKVIKVP